MTITELRRRLRLAQAETGGGHRFSVAFHQPENACSILLWTRRPGSTDEECQEIGHGAVAECVAALDRYVARHRTTPENKRDAEKG